MNTADASRFFNKVHSDEFVMVDPLIGFSVETLYLALEQRIIQKIKAEATTNIFPHIEVMK